jgi:hypothetical protein
MCCRCSSAEERLKPRPSPPLTFYVLDGLTEGRLSAHNGEDVGSKPTAGKTKLFFLFSFTHTHAQHVYNSYNQLTNI